MALQVAAGILIAVALLALIVGCVIVWAEGQKDGDHPFLSYLCGWLALGGIIAAGLIIYHALWGLEIT